MDQYGFVLHVYGEQLLWDGIMDKKGLTLDVRGLYFRLKYLRRGAVASFYPKPNQKPGKDIKQFSLLVTVPALMFAAPAVGYVIGQWADNKFGTEPYLLIVGVVLGFTSAGVEVYRIVKKSAALDEKDEDEKRI